MRDRRKAMAGFLGTGWGANVGEGVVLACVNPGEGDDLSLVNRLVSCPG
jgi:hypothetical protein